MPIEKQNLEDYLCTGRYCRHETSEKHYIVDEYFIKNLLLEREKELYAKVKEYFKLTSNRGDNIGEYLARNVILQEDILEIIDQSLLDIDEKAK